MEIELFCAKCGAGLAAELIGRRVGKSSLNYGRSFGPCIEIHPCESCIEDAKNQGREEVETEKE